MDRFISFLEEFIPNRNSRILLVLCLVLALPIFSFSGEVLALFGVEQTPQIELSLRLLLPMLIMLLGVGMAYVQTVLFYQSSLNLDLCKFHKKVTLSVGEYYELKETNFPIRFTLKDISLERMPSPHEATPKSLSNYVEIESATLSFSPPFYFRCGSNCVKKQKHPKDLSEESFIMSKYQGSDEDSSVFFFNIENSTNGENFFRCFVNHINPNNKQVELDIYYLHLKT